jgi:small conductance mechanosensitive channel
MFPNGTISALANLSKAFSYAVVDFKIHYREDVDRVLEASREVGAAIEKDALWRSAVLAPLDLVGVVSLMDNAATVRVKFKTLPLEQGKVANELRRRLMKALAERGIRPYTA